MPTQLLLHNQFPQKFFNVWGDSEYLARKIADDEEGILNKILWKSKENKCHFNSHHFIPKCILFFLYKLCVIKWHRVKATDSGDLQDV